MRRDCFVRQVSSFGLKKTVLLILDSEPVLEESIQVAGKGKKKSKNSFLKVSVIIKSTKG